MVPAEASERKASAPGATDDHIADGDDHINELLLLPLRLLTAATPGRRSVSGSARYSLTPPLNQTSYSSRRSPVAQVTNSAIVRGYLFLRGLTRGPSETDATSDVIGTGRPGAWHGVHGNQPQARPTPHEQPRRSNAIAHWLHRHNHQATHHLVSWTLGFVFGARARVSHQPETEDCTIRCTAERGAVDDGLLTTSSSGRGEAKFTTTQSAQARAKDEFVRSVR